ncbi:MAG: hypothetical protein MI785_04995 [Kiloniellales bacterium]|nr:hypothetical protein [Kiloniellales bacterium]
MAEPAKDAMIAGRFRVDPARRLPLFDQPSGLAYQASDQKNPSQPVFGLVCRPDMQPRRDVFTKLSRLRLSGLLAPRAIGPLHWAPDDAEREILVFPQLQGKRLAERPDGRFEPLAETRLSREVLPPLVAILKELDALYIAHRAIRADNLFFCGTDGKDVVLGECVSALPGLFQPVAFETIESAQALPGARGAGRRSEDLYALGALILALLCGGPPATELGDDELILRKITRGSCAALAGSRRLSPAMMELLRGLLYDDPKERWGLDEVQLWLAGRRMSPRQVLLPPRAQRGITISGRRCEMDREVAHVLAQGWSEGIELAASGELEGWVRRSLGDEERSKRMTRSRAAVGGSPLDPDLMLSRALAILDPAGPIRFKGLVLRLDGLPGGLAQDFENEERRELFTQILAQRLPIQWIELRGGGGADVIAFKKLYEALHSYLGNPGFGFGIERCLYEANPGLACRSPSLARFRVTKIEDLLPALDRLAAGQSGGTGPEFVDRHIAAFCAARARDLGTEVFKALNKPDDLASRRMAALKLLAEVQKLAGPPGLPNLARAMAVLLEPVIQGFHNRPYREELIAEVETTAAQGSLDQLLKVLDDPKVQRGDQLGFQQAQALHRAFTREIDWLEAGGLTDPAQIRRTASQVTAVLSTLAAVLVLVATAALEVFSL